MAGTDLATHLKSMELSFNEKNDYALTFESECHFALQQITKTDSVFRVAQSNQPSLHNAIMNIAAVGISLNPALAHAYLVPRDGAICLDVSYRGLVKLATDSGAIVLAKAELVYEGDTFEWHGPLKEPTHIADVLNPNRVDAANPLNNLKGGYCIAKLPTGEIMVEVMSAAEILKVRDTSKAKKGPWAGPWAGQMAKKTLIKRASKSWPQSSGRERLDRAIEILNEHEGLEEENKNQTQERPPALDHWPDDEFNGKLPKWTHLIQQRGKTPEFIINFAAENGRPFTEAQKQIINQLGSTEHGTDGAA